MPRRRCFAEVTPREFYGGRLVFGQERPISRLANEILSCAEYLAECGLDTIELMFAPHPLPQKLLIKSEGDYYIYGSGRPELLSELLPVVSQHQLTEILRINVAEQAQDVADLDVRKLQPPSYASRAFDTLKTTSWGKNQYMKILAVQGLFAKERTTIDDLFPRDDYRLPSPTPLISDLNDTFVHLLSGRNALIWDLKNKELYRFTDLSEVFGELEATIKVMWELELHPLGTLHRLIMDKAYGIYKLIPAGRKPVPRHAKELLNATSDNFMPYGWSNHSKELLFCRRRFPAGQYRLSHFTPLLAHDDTQNFLVQCGNGCLYLWNHISEYLDRIDFPLELSTVLLALNDPATLRTTSVPRTMESKLANKLGLSPRDALLPSLWYERRACLQYKMVRMQTILDMYGFLTVRPLLIYQRMDLVLLKCDALFCFWDRKRPLMLFRITWPTEIRSLLQALDNNKILRRLGTKMKVCCRNGEFSIDEQQKIRVIDLCRGLPAKYIPAGWERTSERIRNAPKGFFSQWTSAILRRQRDSMLLLVEWDEDWDEDRNWCGPSIMDFLLWKPGTRELHLIEQPTGLLEILRVIDDPERLKLVPT